MRPLEGRERDDSASAVARVETWTITPAEAWVEERADIELVLITSDADLARLAQALDPPAWWAYENLRAPANQRLAVSVREVPRHTTAHADVGEQGVAPASSGTLRCTQRKRGVCAAVLSPSADCAAACAPTCGSTCRYGNSRRTRNSRRTTGSAAQHALDAAVQAGDAAAIRAE